jgi:nucleotide-binding universal stress UspA family protein
VNDRPDGPSPRRILVALDTHEHSGTALEEAARLAAGLQAELVGLCIEDTELLAAAALPVTRIIPNQAWATGALDPETMQRALRIWSAEARKSLATTAARWQVRWSFQVARGGFAEELLSQAGQHDLVAFQTDRRLHRSRGALAARQVAARARCSVFLMERRASAGRPVAALYEGNNRVLEVGRAIAGIYNLGLVVVTLGETDRSAGALGDTARQFLKDEPRLISIGVPPDDTAAEVRAALRRHDPGVVVFHRQGALAGEIESALEELDCSVFVVG